MLEFTLNKTGTLSEVREALNAAIAADASTPHTERNAVIRAACHYAVVENLDVLQEEHAKDKIAAAAVSRPMPGEPTTSVSISIVVDVHEIARKG